MSQGRENSERALKKLTNQIFLIVLQIQDIRNGCLLNNVIVSKTCIINWQISFIPHRHHYFPLTNATSRFCITFTPKKLLLNSRLCKYLLKDIIIFKGTILFDFISLIRFAKIECVSFWTYQTYLIALLSFLYTEWWILIWF